MSPPVTRASISTYSVVRRDTDRPNAFPSITANRNRLKAIEKIVRSGTTLAFRNVIAFRLSPIIGTLN